MTTTGNYFVFLICTFIVVGCTEIDIKETDELILMIKVIKNR